MATQKSGDRANAGGRYHPGEDFEVVFEREVKEWVEPALTLRRGREPGEEEKLANRERPDQTNNLVGLALSGGGIRSATFALGASQAMAKYGVLERVDYLSTVSGGGYLGSALSSLLHQQALNQDSSGGDGSHPLSKERFPFRFTPEAPAPDEIEVMRPEEPAVQHIREHSNYLAPRFGLLDPLTWRTLLDLGVRLVANLVLISLPVLLVLLLLALVPEGAWDRVNPMKTPWMVWDPAGLIGVALVASVVMVLWWPSTRQSEVVDRVQQRLIEVLLVAALWLGFVWGTAGVMRLEGVAYQWFVGSFGTGAAGFLAAARWAFNRLGELEQEPAGGGKGGQVANLARTVLFKLAGFLVLAAGILLLFHVLDQQSWRVQLTLLGVTLFVYFGIWLSEMATSSWQMLRLLNWVSLHAIYRHRLSGAYLLREEVLKKGEKKEAVTGGVDIPLARLQIGEREVAKKGLVTKLRQLINLAPSIDGGAVERRPVGPFHVLTTSLNMAGSTGPKEMQRKSDSFFFSSLYSGSYATGYVQTDCAYQDLSLGAAMALSGAAFSPNQGVYTAPSTAILMTLANARLGQWVVNSRSRESSAKTSAVTQTAQFLALWYYYARELFGLASGKDPAIYLTDGGHFDNSGIYELLRRRCRYIIAVDAAGEPSPRNPQFGTLGVVSRLARVDFGVDIQIDLTPLMPDANGRTPASWVAGHIFYPPVKRLGPDGTPISDEQVEEERKGVLVYLKATMTPDDRAPDLEWYVRQDPIFPNHSTADQFFDEAQFESYRALGYHIARSAFKGVFLKEGPAGEDLVRDREAFKELNGG